MNRGNRFRDAIRSYLESSFKALGEHVEIRTEVKVGYRFVGQPRKVDLVLKTIIISRRGPMTSQDQKKQKRKYINPGDYIPKWLKAHYGDMDWIETHEKEYKKGVEEFAQRMKEFGWTREMAANWLNRAMWFRRLGRNLGWVRHYPSWARYWEKEEGPQEQ